MANNNNPFNFGGPNFNFPNMPQAPMGGGPQGPMGPMPPMGGMGGPFGGLRPSFEPKFLVIAVVFLVLGGYLSFSFDRWLGLLGAFLTFIGGIFFVISIIIGTLKAIMGSLGFGIPMGPQK